MRGKNMSVENLQYKINDRLEKRLSSLEKIAFDGSTFKSKTNDEIKKVMPKINETLKSINESIYD